MAAGFSSARKLREFFEVEDGRRRRFIGNGDDVRGFQIDHDGGKCRSVIAFLDPWHDRSRWGTTVQGRSCGSGKDALTDYLSRVALTTREKNMKDEDANGRTP